MSLRNDFNDQPPFNHHLSDAYCFALLADNHEQAQSILAMDDRIRGTLIEKFCEALDTNNIKLLNALYKTGLIDINGFAANGDTPLIHALRNKRANSSAIGALLTFPALDINQKSKEGAPPLLFAAHPKSIQQLCLLLRHPAIDVNATDKDGFTALMQSARYEDIHIVSELLKHPHIDVNARNCYGMTAFMMMVSFEEPRIVDMMLRTPTLNIRAKDNEGRTAVAHASRWGNIQCSQKIKSFEIN